MTRIRLAYTGPAAARFASIGLVEPGAVLSVPLDLGMRLLSAGNWKRTSELESPIRSGPVTADRGLSAPASDRMLERAPELE